MRLGKHWGADRVLFLKFVNIGSYGSEEFDANNGADERHPEHARFRDIMTDPILRDPIVNMFNLQSYLN